MSVVEVVEAALGRGDARLAGHHLDRPRQGDLVLGGGVELIGWVLGGSAPAVAVEVVAEGAPARRVPLSDPRPDLAAAFPGVAPGAGGGYRVLVEAIGMGEVSLELRAVLADQGRVPLASVRFVRRWREDAYHADPPLVSVVIPCYRQAHFLHEAIESVHAQTWPHLEVVVVDDGSPDNVAAVVARYPGVRLVRQENAGVSAARNAGIRHTNGAYLVFLDADDRLLPHAVATGLAAFEAHPEAAFVAGRTRMVSADGVTVLDQDASMMPATDPYRALLSGCFIWMPGAVMFRRPAFELSGVFASDINSAADYDIYLRMAREFPVWCSSQVVAEHRGHGENMSADKGRMLTEGLQVLGREEALVRDQPELMEALEVGRQTLRAFCAPELDQAGG